MSRKNKRSKRPARKGDHGGDIVGARDARMTPRPVRRSRTKWVAGVLVAGVVGVAVYLIVVQPRVGSSPEPSLEPRALAVDASDGVDVPLRVEPSGDVVAGGNRSATPDGPVVVPEDRALALREEGDRLLGDGDLAGAIERYREAIELDESEAIYYNLGIALTRSRRFDEAVEAYRSAVELAPEYAEVYQNLGNVFTAMGRFDEAIEQYETVMELMPDYPVTHNNLGKVYALQGKSAEAIGEFNRALEIDPEYLPARYNLGSAMSAQDRFDDAAKEYEAILALNPNFTPAIRGLARVRARIQAAAGEGAPGDSPAP